MFGQFGDQKYAGSFEQILSKFGKFTQSSIYIICLEVFGQFKRVKAGINVGSVWPNKNKS